MRVGVAVVRVLCGCCVDAVRVGMDGLRGSFTFTFTMYVHELVRRSCIDLRFVYVHGAYVRVCVCASASACVYPRYPGTATSSAVLQLCHLIILGALIARHVAGPEKVKGSE
jgi:hypothetical protein